MQMQVDELDGVKNVTLSGRLDTAGVSAVEAQFAATIAPAGRHTVVDLSEVTFLASLGVRMFVTTTRALSRNGGRLAMYGAAPAVMETIEVMAFSDLVPVVETQAEAVALVKG